MPTKLGSNNIDLKIGNQTVDKMFLGSTQVYEHQTPPPTVAGRLKLTFLESGTFSFTCDDESEHEGIDLNYRLNNGAETPFSFGEEIEVEEGDVVELFGDNETFSNLNSAIYCVCSVQFNLSGDIRSLLSKNDFESITTILDYAFWYMFSNQPVVSAEDLIISADYIGLNAFDDCFYGCQAMTTAPKEIVANTVGPLCFWLMFGESHLLNTSPDFKITTFAFGSLKSCFNNCSSLTQLPRFYATTIPSNCCEQMFRGCSQIKLSTTQTGEYQNAYHIPNGVSASYTSMFASTGGTFTGTPNPNTTYYTSNEIVGDE